MNMVLNKKNVEFVSNYLFNGEITHLPKWLQYLVDAEEIHQNYEYIGTIKELSPQSVVHYVYRTLDILEGLKESFLTEEMYWQLATVLSYSEVAKGGTFEQRNLWLKKGYNLMAHNEGSANIFLEDYMGYDKPLIYILIKTHGLIGQYLRGETRLVANLELVDTIRSYYVDEEAKELLLHLNHCIIGSVSNDLWIRVEKDVQAAIEKLFNLDFHEEFEIRIHKLTSGFKESLSEKREIMNSNYEKVRSFLEDKDLWYVEPSMHDLTFQDFWTIFVLAADKLTQYDVKHINFETFMQQLHYDYKGKKHNNVYRKRVIEKFLHEYRMNQNPDTTHVNFTVEVVNKFKTSFISFEFSGVGEALINFCVEAEKSGGIMHNRATVLLFDLFELRRDAYDRFNNESTYLEHMNSSGDDKRVILDYIVGDEILDVGPGGGVLLDMLEAETLGKSIKGIDISENVIDVLKEKKKIESHTWDVLKGDALNLTDSFASNSLDTIIYSSIIHELFSYIPYEGKKFNYNVIKATLESAYAVLKPGGRIIIRDGIMTENKLSKRIIRFKNDNGMRFLNQYAKDFKGREIQYEILSDTEVKMDINDSMEFLYTYTWGPESYAHEINEQFGYFTPNEYKNFVENLFGDKVKIVQLNYYLQEGYTINLNESIDFETEDGMATPLPDSTCLIVIEKI